jgi:hypothetical protein
MSNMAFVRAAREEDIPRILELYQQLAITDEEAKSQRTLSFEHYREAFYEAMGFKTSAYSFRRYFI